MQDRQAKSWLESTARLLQNDENAINDTYYVQSGKRGPISQKILQATVCGVEKGKQRELGEHKPQNHRTTYNPQIHGDPTSESDEEEEQENSTMTETQPGSQ